MAESEFVRDNESRALINNDMEKLRVYKERRMRTKRQKSLEERLEALEKIVEEIVNARSK